MWLLGQDPSPPDPSTWSAVIGPYGALALALIVMAVGARYFVGVIARRDAVIESKEQIIEKKDAQLAESEARKVELIEKMVPALTENTQALRETLEWKGRR